MQMNDADDADADDATCHIISYHTCHLPHPLAWNDHTWKLVTIFTCHNPSPGIIDGDHQTCQLPHPLTMFAFQIVNDL